MCLVTLINVWFLTKSTFKYPFVLPKDRATSMDENLSEKMLIARLEEENGEMIREMEMLKQQQVMLFSFFFSLYMKSKLQKQEDNKGRLLA